MSTKITDHMLKGTSIRTLLQRAAAEAGFNLVNGSFEEGAVVTKSNDVVWFRNKGTYYGWGGTIPVGGYIVPAGSTPATAGGVGALLWVDRTAIILRANLAATTGAGLVGTTDGITVQAKLNTIALKANTLDVNAALALKANTSDLATKADTATVISRTKNGGLTTAVAGGAMTLTQAKRLFSFRSVPLTNGDTVEVTPAADLTLNIPSGATLGTSSARQANLIPVILYNSGNPVLGVVNLAGGLDLSEAGLLSATAISASSNSVSVVYASVAVTNSPYIVAGIVQSTQATAGTWATAPNVIPKSTNLATMIGGVGYSAPIDVSASRALGTTYYNTSSKPKKVKVSVSVSTAAASSLSLGVSGVVVASTGFGTTPSATTRFHNVEWIVQPGGSYSVAASVGSSIVVWVEA